MSYSHTALKQPIRISIIQNQQQENFFTDIKSPNIELPENLFLFEQEKSNKVINMFENNTDSALTHVTLGSESKDKNVFYKDYYLILIEMLFAGEDIDLEKIQNQFQSPALLIPDTATIFIVYLFDHTKRCPQLAVDYIKERIQSLYGAHRKLINVTFDTKDLFYKFKLISYILFLHIGKRIVDNQFTNKFIKNSYMPSQQPKETISAIHQPQTVFIELVLYRHSESIVVPPNSIETFHLYLQRILANFPKFPPVTPIGAYRLYAQHFIYQLSKNNIFLSSQIETAEFNNLVSKTKQEKHRHIIQIYPLTYEEMTDKLQSSIDFEKFKRNTAQLSREIPKRHHGYVIILVDESFYCVCDDVKVHLPPVLKTFDTQHLKIRLINYDKNDTNIKYKETQIKSKHGYSAKDFIDEIIRDCAPETSCSIL